MARKYKTEGIGKNKKIMKERRKPLPLELMKNDAKRPKSRRERLPENPFLSEII